MITFTFHIIKLNVLSALMICLTMLLGRITRKHYALQWKYWIWLLTALLLLFPINTSSISAVHLQVNAPVRSLTHDTPTARMQADAAVTSDVPPTPASSHGKTIVLSNSTVAFYSSLHGSGRSAPSYWEAHVSCATGSRSGICNAGAVR